MQLTNSNDSLLFLRLLPNETYEFYPDDILKIGSLEFILMRFNYGIGRELGINKLMEDNELVIQNLRISSEIPCSMFCIIDG